MYLSAQNLHQEQTKKFSFWLIYFRQINIFTNSKTKLSSESLSKFNFCKLSGAIPAILAIYKLKAVLNNVKKKEHAFESVKDGQKQFSHDKQRVVYGKRGR